MANMTEIQGVIPEEKRMHGSKDPKRFSSAGLLIPALIGLVCGGGLPALPGALGADGSASRSPAVSELIEQLGSESYATRQRAKDALQRVGLEAFDQLHQAQFHHDSEIALSARYLLRSVMVSWSKESDPEVVRETLQEYGACDENERSSRIDRLAEFANRSGLAALVRVACFERSLRLSRHAALAAMQQTMALDEGTRKRNSEQIVTTLGENKRQAAAWLRAYAEDLAKGEYSSERWRELIEEQRREIDTVSNQNTWRDSVLELVRVCATRAAAAGNREEALELAAEHMDLVAPSTRSLIEACTWAIDNELHPFVLALQSEHDAMFAAQPILLYGAAEAEQAAGRIDAANLLAEQASQINPLPADEKEQAKMQPKDLEEAAKSHREIANKLAQRGLFQWSEREYRLIIDSLALDSYPSIGARTDLSVMLADMNRHQDVVDVLQPLLARLKNDGRLRQQLTTLTFRSYADLLSSATYHEAMAKVEKGKADEAKSQLVRAYKLDRRNIDILIKMYHLDGDEDWRNLVMGYLRAATRESEGRIEAERDSVRQFGGMRQSALGQMLNNYAWLVSNTEGDQQQALKFSIEATELEPTGANLDTCARCYYAVGDYENAVITQRRALKLLPHSPPLIRQLELFEAARDKARQEGVNLEEPKSPGAAEFQSQ